MSAEDPAPLPADVLSEQQLLNYVDIAVREHLPGVHEAARVVLRETMRLSGSTDPIQTASEMCRAIEAEKGSITVKQRALLYAAGVHVRDEGRAGREQVSTQDRPAPVPEAKGKSRKGRGKKDGKAKHKPARPPSSWVKALGKDVLILEVVEPVDDADLLAALQKGAGPKGPHIGKDARAGWCQVRDLLDTEFPVLPRVGGDNGVLLWGFRRDEKKGLPTARLRAEAGALARARKSEAGDQAPTREEVATAYDELAAKWYASATPTSTLVPLTYHRDEGRILVHTRSTKLRDAIREAIGPGVKRRQRSETWTELERRDPAATDLRRENGVGEGKADLGRDLLLWVCARTMGGTGVLTLPDAERVEFWVDDKVKLSRSVPGEKAMRIELAKAPTEGGSLAAALADGAQPWSMRVTLRAADRDTHVTIEDGQAVAFGLPCLIAPDGSDGSITDALTERILLFDEADRLFGHLLAAFLTDRAGGWGQRMTSLRQKLGLEIAKRYGWNPTTKQGFLFAHMLEGQQTTLEDAAEALEAKNAEPTTSARPSRGRRGRDAAAAA